MNFRDFFAGPDDNDRRLDRIIKIFLPQLPSSEIFKALRKNLIRVNDKKSKPDYRVSQGDKISIADFLLNNTENNSVSPKESKISQDKINLPEIVFQNENFLIFNKPANLAVHGENSLEKEVRKYFQLSEKKSDSLSFTPGPLHRIDRNTTGLIAFSWSLKGAQWFTENIKNHSINKIYYGILQGKVSETKTWKDKLDKEENQKNFYRMNIVSDNEDAGKEAVTTVIPKVYGRYKNVDFTLCQIIIETGRQHQIRAQCSAHEHPLLGDSAYNGKTFDKEIDSFFLHAAKLKIPDNNLGLPSELSAPLPEKMHSFLLKTCDMHNVEL